jgi:hypothetical protein
MTFLFNTKKVQKCQLIFKAEIQIFTPDLPLLQQRDKFAAAGVKFLKANQLPANKHQAACIAHVASSCFLEDYILWRCMMCRGTPARTVLVVLAAQVNRRDFMARHKGFTKTKEPLLQSCFWPNMDKDIARHVEACQHCH